MPESPPRLRAASVRVEKGRRLIVRDVTVNVTAGEVLGILGPSGAGKSTLFGALVGEETLTAGRVFMAGNDVTSLALWQRARQGLGYIPQSPSVLWDLTVRESFQTYIRIAQGRRAPADEIEKSASRVDLARALDIHVGALSGGERRRLELGRALTTSPRLLVCDEPFAGLDPKGAARLGELLQEQASAGVAILVADHHVEEALRICTRALLLLDGTVAAEGDPAAFREDPLVRERYLGTWVSS